MMIRKTTYLIIAFLLTVVCGNARLPTDPVFLPATDTVTIDEDAVSYRMGNGIVSITVAKRSGSLTSISYKGKEMLAGRDGRAAAMWSHDASSPDMHYTITIDPRKNNGTLGEISIKGISGGRPMGNGPGGSFIADIEIRYALHKGESGLYTYCLFDHETAYPASSMGEARFVAFLNRGFDWIAVDDKRNFHYPLQENGLDLSKYRFTANQKENPAFGWVNTKTNTGFWLINPSNEYMSGGPTKVDFLCHRDTKINGAPCVLNYWRSSHYGGSIVDVGDGEKWSKLIGPFMIYLNEGVSPAGCRSDAYARFAKENAAWPYSWVAHKDYPLSKERGTVTGKIVLKDPGIGGKYSRLRVGLSAPDYPVVQNGVTRMVDWQYDTKFYQFWVEGNAQGEFTITGIRPGTYTLHAIADGVLGEYTRANVEVKAGGKLQLGDISWLPVRHGKQLWDIGIANRNASEFLNGDKWFKEEVFKDYPKIFPDGVSFIIGKCDPAKDWYYLQPPHVKDPDAPENNTIPETSKQALIKALGVGALPAADQQTSIKVIEALGLSGKYARGRATTWSIQFAQEDILKGKLILRLAICGTSARQIAVTVNGKPAGLIQGLRIDGAPSKSGFTGMWYERSVEFDASLLTKGNNRVELTVPEGLADAAIMYDYIRLEHKQ